MLYQYVKRYLKNTFVQAKEDFVWTSLNSIQFSSFVKERYTEEELLKEISEVKEAFKDFFAPVGKIVFRYSGENGIKMKIFPYRVDPKDSKHLKNILKIIENNKKYIKRPYKEENDQIAILGKIRREVNKEVFDTDESINIRELITYAIRVALKLNKEDIIVQLKRIYIVKIATGKSTLTIEEEVSKNKKEGTVNKFNGYTAEQIEETYKEIFQKNDVNIKYFLKAAMKNTFKNTLNFRVISNTYYEKKSLSIIRQVVSQELNNYSELENDYLLGIATYLMKKNFILIHEFMAIELIECIHEKDQNANNFLLYYNGKTILINNKKYIIPSLETEDGRQWNNSSLIGICNLWMNTKRRKESFDDKLVDVEMKLTTVKAKMAHIEPEKKLQEKTIKETEKKALSINKKHAELESKLDYLGNTNLNSTEYFELETIVAVSNIEVVGLETIIAAAKSNLRALKDANLTTFTDLELLTNLKNKLLRDIQSQNSNLIGKNSQIDPIMKSIINVLMDRTKLAD